VKKTERTTAISLAVFWIALGVLVCFGASRLGLGTVTEPGSGFIFFWSGLILVILSIVDLTEFLHNTEGLVRKTGKVNWIKIALVILSLLLYAFFLERLGFMLTTFVLLSFLLGLIERIDWVRSFGLASAAALGSFTIFEVWLKIRLPKGIFGF
jgi:putative tricarboxylic transport membrane protein